MADTLTFFQILDLIQQQFAQYVPLLTKPGVFAVLGRAMQDGNSGHPWTADRITAELQNTPYFRTTTAAGRAWDGLQATDPATAGQKATLVKQQIDDLQRQFGVVLDTTGGFSSPAFQFFTKAVQQGWTPDQIKYNLLASVNKTSYGSGELGNNAAQIKAMANDYGVPLSDKTVMGYATQLAQGAMTAASIKGYLITQAQSRFPGLAGPDGPLARGVTVRQVADPYLQIAQQELGTNTATVNLTDPKWMAALDTVDPKTGTHSSMSLSDWTRTVRSNPIYGYDSTIQAQTQVASLATQLMQKMGAIS